MRATQILAVQHQAIAALFEGVEGEGDPCAREHAVGRLAEELIAHMAGEETVFFPALRRLLGREEPLLARAWDEHATLRMGLRELLASQPGDTGLDGRLGALRATFERHVLEEERGLFPRVDRALRQADHEVLGSEIAASRPPIWMVISDGPAHHRSGPSAKLRSRVSLPLPATRG